MRKPPYYYLKNISRRWHTEIKKVDGKVIILSPYLTSKTAEGILRDSKFSECEIYTIFSVHNFISGASSLKTLKCLYDKGCKLYHLPRLHAKIIISPGRFATIGSQNLTRNGVKNKEASVITFDVKEVNKIEELLNQWIPQRKCITSEMIQHLEDKIINLRKKFNLINRELKKEINDLQDEIWQDEEERIEIERLNKEAEEKRLREEQRLQELKRVQEEKRKQEEQRKLEAKRVQEEQNRKVVNTIRDTLQQLTPHGQIKKELAEEFIRTCAYWDQFPRGDIVNAPKYAKHIKNYRDNWIVYTGNSFSISYAIYNCQQVLLEFLQEIESGKVMSRSQLLEKLELIVKTAVIKSNGDKFINYYNENWGNFLWFGNQGICISDFVNLILTKGGIDDRLFGLIE